MMPGSDRTSPPLQARRGDQAPVRFEQFEPRLLLNGALPGFDTVEPFGSLIHYTQAADEIEAVGDADNHTFTVDTAGQATILLDASPDLKAEVKVFRGLNSLGAVQAAEAGENVVLADIVLDEAGDYTILVTGVDDTTGTYDIEVVVGASVDSDVYGGAGNDTLAAAQNIDESFIALVRQGRRAGVLGGTTDLFQDFETGQLDPLIWETSLSLGRIEATDAHTAAAGDYAMWMDLFGGGGDVLNEAVWTVDLSGMTTAYLHFSHAEYNDDEHAFAGAFTGQADADGVAISADGISWYPVWDAVDQPEGEWRNYTIDLAAEATNAGIALGSGFRIKFQQYDDDEIPSAGRGWDDVHITESAAADRDDWYAFSVTDAGDVALAVTSFTGKAMALELYNAAEEPISQSVFVGTNVTEVVTDVTVVPGRYYVRVTGHDDYSLVVTTSASFDIQWNNQLASAQDITDAPIVLGGIYGLESHFYRFSIDTTEDIAISTLTPMGDSLDPQIVLYDASGVQLAADDNGAADGRNASLTFAPPSAGTYSVEVRAASGSGEFVLDAGQISRLPAFSPYPPLGSLVYGTGANDREIEAAGDTDVFTFEVDGPVLVSVEMSTASELQGQLRLYRGTDELGSASADAPKQNVVISGVQLTEAGVYTLVVSGLAETTGTYDIVVFQRALCEEGDADNGSLQTAQPIDASFVDLNDGTARRASIVGTLPELYEDFEDGSAAVFWSSDATGRIEVTDAHATGRGEYSLWMDRSDGKGYTLNEAVWTADLTGATVAFLHFSHAEYGDDEHAFDGPFVDHADADGVAISADGITWYPVWDAVDQPYVEWQDYTIDLVEEATKAGIAIGPNFRIKFQQYDDGSISSAGRGWDDIHISKDAAADDEDWYSFITTGDGTFTILADTGHDVELELYADVETLLAKSEPLGTTGQLIADFAAPPSEYYVRVTGEGPYHLLVLTESTFNTHENTSPDTAQDITPTGVVLGAILGTDVEGRFYEFATNDGDELTIETFTPAGDELDPAITLYRVLDDGTTEAAGLDEDGAADGRNALLTHTAAGGTYRVAINGESGTTGEYVLSVTGQTGEGPAFEVLVTDPADGVRLAAAPTQITVDFSDSLSLATLDPEDLTVDGVEATDVTIVDHDTATFDLPALHGEGFFAVRIEAGAVASAGNTGIEAYTGTFKIGATPPVVVSSSIQEGKILPTGDLTCTATFSEPLNDSGLEAGDVSLLDSQGTAYAPNAAGGFEYDAETRTLTLEYSDLPGGQYTLRLISGDGRFEDLVGDDLDGETPRWPIPSYTSGDGVAGGDFVVNFTLEDLAAGRPGEISFGNGTVATYYDADGDLVTIRLTGPGQGTVNFGFDGPRQMDGGFVELFGTTAASSLSINVANGAKTSILSIFVHGSIGGIHAGSTDLVTGISVDGGLKSLVLGDLPAGSEHLISLNSQGGELPPLLRLWATFDEVADCTLDTGGIPVYKLTATQWDDGELIAPWARDIRITGDGKYGIRGDFGADITLDSADKKGYSLWWLKVAGKVTDSNVDGSSGIIKWLAADQWDSGSISGRVLQTLLIRGQKKDDSITGAFGADLTLTWDFFSRNVFGNCRIAGPIVGGTWTITGLIPTIKAQYISAEWQLYLTGMVKTITARDGIGGTISARIIKSIVTRGVFSGTVDISGSDKGVSLRSLCAGLVDGAEVSVSDKIGSIRVDEWRDGRISASRIGSLTVKGNRREGLAGDFSADVILRGSDDRGNDLGRVMVFGDVGANDGTGVSWLVTGSVGSITVRGNAWGWQGGADGRIGSVRIRRLSDSQISASSIGTLKVASDVTSTKITASASNTGGTALGRVTVGGRLTDTDIEAASGALGSVVVGQWGSGTLKASSLRSIATRTGRKNPAITGDLGATVDVLGSVGTVTVAGDLSGAWTVRSIRSATVRGSVTDADITLTHTPHTRQLALGSLKVAGWIDNSRIFSAGYMGTVNTGAVRDSTIFAGLSGGYDTDAGDANDDGVLDLLDPGADLYAAGAGGAGIGNLIITGKTTSAGGFSLINSNVAAAEFGKVVVSGAKTDNDAVPFGFASGLIRSFTYQDAASKTTWKEPASFNLGDMAVVIE